MQSLIAASRRTVWLASRAVFLAWLCTFIRQFGDIPNDIAQGLLDGSCINISVLAGVLLLSLITVLKICHSVLQDMIGVCGCIHSADTLPHSDWASTSASDQDGERMLQYDARLQLSRSLQQAEDASWDAVAAKIEAEKTGARNNRQAGIDVDLQAEIDANWELFQQMRRKNEFYGGPQPYDTKDINQDDILSASSFVHISSKADLEYASNLFRMDSRQY